MAVDKSRWNPLLWGTVLIVLVGAACDDSGRSVWKDVIKKCADNDLLGSDVLYFGPSNQLGPGSVFRKTAQGGYNVIWLPVHYLDNPQDVVQINNSVTCSGEYVSKKNFDAALALQSLATIGGNLQVGLSRTKDIRVKATSIAWHDLVEGPFRLQLNSLDPSDPRKLDLQKQGRYVVTRGLLVKGLSAELTFDSAVGASLKAEYNGVVSAQGTPGLSVDLEFGWGGNTHLTLSATDFYIAGELSPIEPVGWASANRLIGNPVRKLQDVQVGAELKGQD